ncbi:MAG: spore coat protein CotJB [Anaerovoracaceae bacterium]
MTKRREMMRNIQELDFVIIDIGLYLNNQPECEKALALFAKYQELQRCAKAEYEKEFGPLNYAGVDVNGGWSWIEKPWPWEVEE